MRSSEQIRKAVQELVQRLPYDKITFAEIAKEANVHWTTVQRYFGSKEALATHLLQYHNPHQADTKSQILRSARHVFAKYGYAGATLDLVAQDAGMTKGAVYWHFSSKSDLYLALCERSLGKLLDGLPQQTHRVLTSNHPIDALRLLLESEFNSCEEDGGERAKLFFEFVASSREPQIRDKLADAYTALFVGTTTLLEDMQHKGLIAKTADPQALSVALHAIINGAVLMWTLAPNQVNFNSLASEIANLLWSGIQPVNQSQ